MSGPVKNQLDSAASALDQNARGLKDAADNILSIARDKAGSVGSDVAKTFENVIDEGKNVGAAAFDEAARTAKTAAKTYETHAPQVKEAVGTAVVAVENFAADVRDQHLRDVIASMSDFAQRKPLTFLGCGVLAGLVLGRVLTNAGSK